VVFEPVPTARARLERLRDGAADLIYDVPPEAVSGPCQGCRFVHHDGATLYYLAPNVRQRPWSDVRVRRAVDAAIDRDGLVRRLNGTGRPAFQAAPPNVFGFDPAVPPRPRDLAAARRLLEQAGHRGGFETSVDVYAERVAMAESVRDDLAELGIAVAVNAVARGDVYDLARTGKRGASLVGWVFSSGETSEFLECCLHTPTQGLGFNNLGGWSNRRIDVLAETNATLLDTAERLAALKEAGAIVTSELPVIPLYVAQDVYGVRDGVAFSPRADGEVWLPDVRPSAEARP
jgi:peptide/nickel transport system substrate-binding protein